MMQDSIHFLKKKKKKTRISANSFVLVPKRLAEVAIKMMRIGARKKKKSFFGERYTLKHLV